MVKRFDGEITEVTVYKYDLMKPLSWEPDCTEELAGCNRLWNKLCVIEKNYVAEVRAVAAPAVEELDTKATVIDTHITALVEERAKLRKAAQRKVPTPETDEQIKTLKAELKEIRAQAKVLRKEAYEKNKDRLKEIDTKRFEAAKEARQTSGLYWPNYNAIMASYERARGRALRAGTELHERRFMGEGRLTNQIQGGMTTKRLHDGTNTQVAILPPQPWQRAKNAATLRFCVHNHVGDEKRAKRMVDFPFIMYRPLPDDALIKEVVVTRRKHGRNWRWAVIFTLTKLKTEFPTPTGKAVAINFGWRKVSDHVLRVATAVHFTGKPGARFSPPKYALIEDDLMRGFEEFERVQSARSKAKNAVIKYLESTGVLTAEGVAPPAVQAVIARMNECKVIPTGLLAELYEQWDKHGPVFAPTAFFMLRSWWLGEGHKDNPNWKRTIWMSAERVRIFGERAIQNEQANRRRWLEDARLYHYRMMARDLVGDACAMILNEHNMSVTARKDESHLPGPARHNRFMAAPSVLRQAIINYAKKHGVEIIEYTGSGGRHFKCGQMTEHHDPEALRLHCAACHEDYDVDINFCQEMLNTTPIQLKAA